MSSNEQIQKYHFDCGCSFEIVNPEIKECDGFPGIKIDYYNIPLDCPTTWDLVKSGHTKGIFQLETNLGRHWAKQSLPGQISELAALIAIIRPGVLKAMIDGKSMTSHYCDRKNAIDEVVYFHESLEPVLNDTYGLLLFQENSTKIATEIAGFTPQRGEVLRKGLGKKLSHIVQQMRQEFVDGAIKVGKVNKEEAEEIFGWIEKGQRYLFCKAHAVGYGFTGYWSAYVKAHFPLHFYTSWLYYSHEKMDPQEEMQLLISDARYFDIDVKPPALNKLLNGDIGHFSLNDGKVYFGIGDIKRIGQSIVDKIIENVKLVEDRLERKIENWSWNDFLIHFSGNITTTAINGIILSGATDYIPGTRQWKLYQYNVWKTLTKKEQEYVRDNCQESLEKSIRKLIDEKPRLSITRKSKLEDLIKTIKNPSSSLDDQPHIVATKETELLGVPLTYTKLDTCENKYIADTTCKEFLDGKGGNMTVAVEIIDSREYIIKKGKMKGEKMMFLAGEDETASIDSFIIFPRSLENKEPFLIKGSTVLLKGKRDNQRKESFIVENVIQI